MLSFEMRELAGSDSRKDWMDGRCAVLLIQGRRLRPASRTTVWPASGELDEAAASKTILRARLMHVINLYQTYADAAVISGQDRGELPRWQRGKDSGFL
jgi:hypothetical protein